MQIIALEIEIFILQFLLKSYDSSLRALSLSLFDVTVHAYKS